MRLSDVKIEKGVNVSSEIQTRGTEPLRDLLDVLDETMQWYFWSMRVPSSSRLEKLYYQMQEYVDEIDRFADRLKRYIQELEQKEG